MKSISLILNVILFIAVAVLFYLHFDNGDTSVDESLDEQNAVAQELQIAYINSDTVLQNYEFFQEKQSELEAFQSELDQKYRNRAQGLQNEVANYQQSLPNLTIGQAKALEEDLVKKQQNLRMYQESLAQDLLRRENEINKELYERVTSFIKDYSLENDIEIVVKYNQGSDILYAGEAMDITRQIIEGLNQQYSQADTTAVTGGN